jgi:UDP-glucose 4-epimerase
MSIIKIKKVLIIGGYGFLGSHLSDYYVSQGIEVIKTTRYFNKDICEENDYWLDYSEKDFLNILSDHKFDAVFYLSGNPYPAYSENNPSYDIEQTILPTINLLNAMVKNKFSGSFWFASSVAVYGKTSLPFQGENDLCQPLSSYALAKLNCEEYIRLYCKNFGINGGAFRIFSTFGEGLKRQIIYDLFKKCKSDSSTLDLYGSGKEARDICYVGDQVLRMSLIADKIKPKGNIYNIGSGISYTTEFIAESVIKILGSSKKIKYIEPIRKFDGYQWTACMKKFSTVTKNIEPNFEKSLEKTLLSYEKN